MAGHMRSERTSGGQFATRNSDVGVKAPFSHQYHQQLHPYASLPPKTHLSASFDGHREPPAKRRKIVAPGKQQTTLDHHFAIAQSRPPEAPTIATVTYPHAQIIETSNNEHITLNISNNDLSVAAGLNDHVVRRHTPRIATPTPTSAPADKQKVDKRTLRSQDEGPRLKSELALYFPNYEDVMFDIQRDSGFITLDTAIYITDDSQRQTGPAQSSHKQPKVTSTLAKPFTPATVDSLAYTTPQGTSDEHNGSPSIDFDMINRTLSNDPEDPLSDAHFFKSHRRAERKEKQLRNIERERAMHEKVQLERILDGLKGHDWLKVLGITGITDSEAKRYEAKRNHFIVEVQFLIDKFRQWKEEEKRQRLEREVARRDDESEEPETEAGSVEPPSSDLNASAARQLQQETANAIRTPTIKPNLKSKLAAAGIGQARPALPPRPPSPELPITSFYSKPHLRATALGKARQGRNVTAFGHLIPDMEDRDFRLPSDYVTEDTLRANARERRRRKRATLTDAV